MKQPLDPNRKSDEAKNFEKSLRHKIVGQDSAIEKMVEIYQMFLAGLNAPGRPVGNLLFLGPTGTGKCLAPRTPVLMHNGMIKMVEDIRVGDLLMGPDSKPRRVISLAHGWDEMYDVIPVKGDKYTVNKSHILSLVMTPNNPPYKQPRAGYLRQRVSNTIVNISIEKYLTKSKTFQHRAKGYRTGVEFAEQIVPIDPYFLGLWLGDGTSNCVEITSEDQEIVETIYATAATATASAGVSIYNSPGKTARYHISNGKGNTYKLSSDQMAIIRTSDETWPTLGTRYNISRSTIGRIKKVPRYGKIQRPKNVILEALHSLGVLNNKHIPLVYKANSRKCRLQLLAGLIDSDGSLDRHSVNNYEYVSKIKRLADDVTYIARSLGLAAYVKPCEKTCQTGNGGTYYRVRISGDTAVVPVRVARKIVPSRKQKKNVLRTGITVKPAGYGEYFGFEIDGDGLFLLGDFTVTHNTRVVEAVAETLFNDAHAMIKINCAEFQHSHEIAKLIGSPPGYLGHRETHPMFTQEAINQWHTEKLKVTLVLLDEIEKASDALWQLLLGILDKGALTLGDNRKVDMTCCIIIMTSNLGAGDMMAIQEGGGLGFNFTQPVMDAKFDKRINESAVNAAKKKFTPEFMNRIDKTVVFNTLRDEHLREILTIELGLLQRRILQAQGNAQFVFACTQPVKNKLLADGTDAKYGARHLKRAIERNLTFPLANLVATGQVKLGDFIQIDMAESGELTFVKEAEGALIPILLEKYGTAGEAQQRPLSNETSASPKPPRTAIEAIAGDTTPPPMQPKPESFLSDVKRRPPTRSKKR